MSEVTVNDIFNNMPKEEVNNEESNNSDAVDRIFGNLNNGDESKSEENSSHPLSELDVRGLGEQYMKESHMPRRSWNPNEIRTPIYDTPMPAPYLGGYRHVPDFTMRRFMDASYDNYTKDVFQMLTDGYENRIKQIKCILTVEEWDILNGTNFMSPFPMIQRYVAIITKLATNNVFEARPEDSVLTSGGYNFLGETTTNIVLDKHANMVNIKNVGVYNARKGDVVSFALSRYGYDGEIWRKL